MTSGPAQSISTAIKSEASLSDAGDVSADPGTMTDTEAERLTRRIESRLGTIADTTDAVIPLIEEAKNGNAHQALGYRSWTEYVSDRFGGMLARLGKSERLPFVELLADQGMSTRAIAVVVGVSKDTVSRDLRAGVSDETPAETTDDFAVMGSATEEEFEVAIAEAKAEGDLSRENVEGKVVTAKNVTGIDGKTYTRPEAKKHRAQPLPDRYRRKAFDVAKATGQLRDLTDNRLRYPPNGAAITDQCAGDVLQALANMVTVVGRLDLQGIATSQRKREFLLTQADRLNDALVGLRNQAGDPR